jgi:transcriptional antiterminator NusG
MWYAIQTYTGQEFDARDRINEIEDCPGLQECFVLEYETQIKFRGQWVTRIKSLFPGYVFVVTDDVDALHNRLRKIPLYTKILGTDAGFVPLSDSESEWISAFTDADNRTIAMSEGIMEGDEIIILSGPLMNRTGWIKKINRRKRLAFLEIEMFGRTIETKVGLNIIKKH